MISTLHGKEKELPVRLKQGKKEHTDSVRDAITKFPRFASLNHQRKVDEIRNVYGWSKEEVGGVVLW